MNPITVLIADDHAVMRQGLKALLAPVSDITVVAEANSGREVLAFAAALRPDVVVMDLTMPELNGIEATRALRAEWPRTQVVVLSMHADAEYLFRAFQAGALGYLLKESAVDELINAIRTVHAGNRYVCSGMALEGLPDNVLDARMSPLESLSARERQVLQLVVEGHSSAAVAASTGLSTKTVETYRSRLMKKLGVKDVIGLVKFAIQHGITRP